MTMDLTGPGGEQSFNLQSWGLLLDLAGRYGWKPAGALRPRDREEPEEEEEGGGPAAELDASDYELPQESPLAGAIISLFPRGNPVLASYFFNDGYRVTAEDARALADALERALPDVPDHDAMAGKTVTHPSMPGERFVRIGTPVNPFEWFGGRKDELREFIAFCRAGGFVIR